MITIGNNNCGETLYEVRLGTGLAWYEVFRAYAYNEQEAVDLVADYCEEHHLYGLYSDHYELADECEAGQSVDEYVEAHNLTCCGNHGIYVSIADVKCVG